SSKISPLSNSCSNTLKMGSLLRSAAGQVGSVASTIDSNSATSGQQVRILSGGQGVLLAGAGLAGAAAEAALFEVAFSVDGLELSAGVGTLAPGLASDAFSEGRKVEGGCSRSPMLSTVSVPSRMSLRGQ